MIRAETGTVPKAPKRSIATATRAHANRRPQKDAYTTDSLLLNEARNKEDQGKEVNPAVNARRNLVRVAQWRT